MDYELDGVCDVKIIHAFSRGLDNLYQHGPGARPTALNFAKATELILVAREA